MGKGIKLPRENVYVCNLCGRLMITVDVDTGVTPMFINCRAGDDKCQGSAISGMYPLAPRPASLPAPEWEWFRPPLSQYFCPMSDYELKGGLTLRKRTDREPVYHKGEWDVEFNVFVPEPVAVTANEPRDSGDDLPTGK